MSHIHFRRLRHVALDQHERAYLLKLIDWADYEPAPAEEVDVDKLKKKLAS